MIQYLDIIIYIITLFACIVSYRRGLLKEILITLAYIPYIASLFYMINGFTQDNFSFDVMILKLSAFGGFYIAYLFFVYIVAKIVDRRTKGLFSETFTPVFKLTAATMGAARTAYFLFVCLIFYSLHVNEPKFLEKSQIADIMYPYAVKIQKYLLKNDFIDNEIVLYEQEFISDKERAGVYIHPIMKKIKKSKQFKELEKTIDKKKIQNNVVKYMNKYNG